MIKVSIIVPVYNVEQYLRECLDSLINQTLKDIEIICVNDGSTDSSLQIVEEYAAKDNRIKIINKENSGYGASMNIGLSNANGEYIGILESDDVAKSEMYEKLYNKIIQNNCEIVKSDYYLYYSSDNKILKNNQIKEEKITNAKQDMSILTYAPSIWSALYKREFLIENNIRFLETPGASYQDTSFYIKTTMMADNILLTPDSYVYYRQDNINSSVNNKGKLYCVVDEFKEIHRYINNYPKLACYKPYVYYIQFSRYHWNLDRIASSFKNEFFDFFYSEYKSYYDSGELNDEAIKFIFKNFNFDLFINSPHKYLKEYLKKKKREELKQFKKNIFSIKLNKKERYVKLFGKIIFGER